MHGDITKIMNREEIECKMENERIFVTSRMMTYFQHIKCRIDISHYYIALTKNDDRGYSYHCYLFFPLYEWSFSGYILEINVLL